MKIRRIIEGVKRLHLVTGVMGFFALGCDDIREPTVPVEVTPAAVTLAAVTPLLSNDVVANYINQPPAVAVLDGKGKPVPGITVVFVVTEGGGGLHRGGKPADGTVTTDAGGIAFMPGWRLGHRPGVNKVLALSDKLNPVTFTVLTVASPHRVATIVAGKDEVGSPGSAIGIPPGVSVADVYGNPIEGVPVSFVVSAGGGSLVDATVLTNSGGLASTTSWTLGPVGRQAVTASFPSPIQPVVINALAADAVDPSCTSVGAIPPNAVLNADLGVEGCRTSSGRPFDLYSATIAADGAYRFTSRSSVFDSYLEIFDSAGGRVAQNDNVSSTIPDSEVKIYLAKGRYTLSVTSLSPTVTGNYAISWGSTDVTGCDIPAIVPNVVISGSVRGCPEPPWGFSSDRYRIYLSKAQGLSLRLDFHDGFMEPTLKVTNAAGTTFSAITNSSYDNQSLSLTYVAATDGYFTVVVADLPEGFGYKLTLR